MKKIDLEEYIESTICDISDFEGAINEGIIVDNKKVLQFLYDLKTRFVEMQKEIQEGS